jgi:hypothetical protein
LSQTGKPLLVSARLDFPAGAYVVVVEARSSGAREQTIVRKVPLRVIAER